MFFDAIQTFRAKLGAGQLCVGVAITLNDPLITEALADSVDFFWIDLEHTAMDPQTLALHLLAARGRGVPALVRVRGGVTTQIKFVLDAGAEGIIIPQVRSVEEVKNVLDDCCYPPLGRRGFGPRVPSNYGRSAGMDYVKRANERLFIAVQIETREALKAIDDIVALDRIDSIVVGPWDLSGALGRLGEVEHPGVTHAIESIVAKSRARGKSVGAGMGANHAFGRHFAKLGVQWMQVGADFEYMIQRADQLRQAVKGETIAEPRERSHA